MARNIVACLATLVVLGGMLALLNFAEPHLKEVTNKPSPQSIETFRFTPQRELKLHLYEPVRTRDHEDETGRPAIVLFYGGGWIGGDIHQFRSQSAALAERGVVAIRAEYRTEQPDGTTPFQALVDALYAVAWVRANAERLGIDPQRIAVGGGSAGGHLAAACATLPDDKLSELAPALTASPRPNALVLFNPVLDNGPGPTAFAFDRIGEDYGWFSPAHNVRPGMPPTLIMLGTNDHLVPVSVATDFRDAMLAYGDTCEVELYEGEAHGFFNDQPGKEAMFAATLQRTITFLEDQGWID
ncbi:MAG: alpha/beta hydrolase [Planctomycetota bacterium]